MKLDLNIGDVILCGKFRNKPVEVAGFDKDENGQPVILTKKGKKVKILCVRIKKLMLKKERRMIKLKDILLEQVNNNFNNSILDIIKNIESILKNAYFSKSKELTYNRNNRLYYKPKKYKNLEFEIVYPGKNSGHQIYEITIYVYINGNLNRQYDKKFINKSLSKFIEEICSTLQNKPFIKWNYD